MQYLPWLGEEAAFQGWVGMCPVYTIACKVFVFFISESRGGVKDTVLVRNSTTHIMILFHFMFLFSV